jgi:hypothetical protein
MLQALSPATNPESEARGLAGWAFRTPSLRGLSFSFAVRCSDRRLGEDIGAVLAPLRVGGVVATTAPEVEQEDPFAAPSHWYTVLDHIDGTVDVFRDEAAVALRREPDSALSWLLWDLNRCVAESSSEHLVFHAGGVQSGDAGVLVPGPSGSGKTTLVRALVGNGFAYLSDELVALTASGGHLLPYPKALTIKLPGPGAQLHLVPEDIRVGAVGTPCEPCFVVAPRYVPDRPSSIKRLSSEDAFVALVTNSVNLASHGARGMELLAATTRRAECFELAMSDLEGACQLIAGVVGI